MSDVTEANAESVQPTPEATVPAAPEETSSQRRKRLAALKKAATEDREPAKKLPAKKPTGKLTAMKKLMLAHPQWDTGRLLEALKRQGVESTPATVSSIRTDLAHTLRTLNEYFDGKVPGAFFDAKG